MVILYNCFHILIYNIEAKQEKETTSFDKKSKKEKNF